MSGARSRCRRRRSIPSRRDHAFELAEPARLRRGRGHGRHRPDQPGRRRDQAPASTTTRSRSAPIHAPCLLITQRVWGTDPWDKLQSRSARWQRRSAPTRRRAPAVPVAARLRAWLRRRASRRPRGRDRRRVRGREHVPVAGRRSASSRPTPRGGTRSTSDYANVTLDLSHTATSGSPTRSRWPAISGRGCDTSTSPTAPAPPRTSTWCPVTATSRAPSCCELLATRGYDGSIVVEINTRKAVEPRRPARRPARVAGVRAAALRAPTDTSRPSPTAIGLPRSGRVAPGTTRHARGDPRRGARRSSPRRATTDVERRASRVRPTSTRRSCTTTSAARTTCCSRRSKRRSTRAGLSPGRRGRRRRTRRTDAARPSSPCGTTRRGCRSSACSSVMRPGRAGQLLATARPAGARAGRRALGTRRRPSCGPLVACQMLGLTWRATCSRLEPLARPRRRSPRRARARPPALPRPVSCRPLLTRGREHTR